MVSTKHGLQITTTDWVKNIDWVQNTDSGIKHIISITDSVMKQRTLGVDYIRRQCCVHRRHLPDMLCNLAYVKNVS